MPRFSLKIDFFMSDDYKSLFVTVAHDFCLLPEIRVFVPVTPPRPPCLPQVHILARISTCLTLIVLMGGGLRWQVEPCDAIFVWEKCPC